VQTQPFFSYPTTYRSSYGAAPAAAMAAFSPATIACMQQEIKARAQGRKANTAQCMAYQQPMAARQGQIVEPSGGGIPTWAWIAGGLALAGGAAYYFFAR
jgi:hypothetical protein